MATIVIKADKGVDLYVAWSFATDGPLACGTRDEMAEWLTTYRSEDGDPEARLARADATGSSGRRRGLGEWDDDGLICRWTHDGEHEVDDRWLPREHLATWLRTGDEALMEPCDG